MDRAHADADAARLALATAREEAAGLRGRIEAIEPLLARLAPGDGAQPPKACK